MNIPPRRLERSLTLVDATFIGIGSMVGAGVYAVWSQAANAAGSQLFIGLAVAASIGWCNAVASGRLAALYPESGGTYVYAYERLGPIRGFIAGWGFVIGKTASCAAIALTAGAYLFPTHDRILAVSAIAIITLVNLGGVERTVLVTKVLLVVTGTILAFVIFAGWTSGDFEANRLGFTEGSLLHSSLAENIYGVLQSAGLLFFAFAGYARIATLGEEVIFPDRTIPRAITLALTAVILLYVIVAVTVVATLPQADLARSTDPLKRVVESSSWDAMGPLVQFGAGIATLGALLNLIPGVSRTALAMARRQDLPSGLAQLALQPPKPVRAEITVALAAIVLILALDVRNAIGVSGVGVLVYYAMTNWSVLTLPLSKFQRLQGVTGLIGCVILVLCLPGWAVLSGSSVLAIGLVIRQLRLSRMSSLGSKI